MFKYIKYIIRAGWYIIGFYPRYLYYLITKNKKTPYEVRYNKTQKTLTLENEKATFKKKKIIKNVFIIMSIILLWLITSFILFITQ